MDQLASILLDHSKFTPSSVGMMEDDMMAKVMGDKLILKGLVFHGYHGAKQEEKTLGQKFLIDIDAWMDLRAAGKSDDLSDTVSYTDIYRIAREVVEGPSQNLLESVAELIASKTLTKHSQISAVRVKVGKPHVAVPGPLDYLGVEITRYREGSLVDDNSREIENRHEALVWDSESKFETREDFLHSVKEFYLKQGCVLSIKSSRKDKYVRLSCDRGGCYRDKRPNPLAERQRKTSSRLINCPFEVQGRRKSDGFWRLHVKNNVHNHEPSNEFSRRSSCRRLSKDHTEHVDEIITTLEPR